MFSLNQHNIIIMSKHTKSYYLVLTNLITESIREYHIIL